MSTKDDRLPDVSLIMSTKNDRLPDVSLIIKIVDLLFQSQTFINSLIFAITSKLINLKVFRHDLISTSYQ